MRIKYMCVKCNLFFRREKSRVKKKKNFKKYYDTHALYTPICAHKRRIHGRYTESYFIIILYKHFFFIIINKTRVRI